MKKRLELCSHLSFWGYIDIGWAIEKVFWCLSCNEREKTQFTNH